VAAWDRTFAVNVRGSMLLCKHVVPLMVAQGGGVIVNMGSRSSLLGDGVRPAYGCSKAAINALSRYVATMYGDRDIRCNTVVPGSVEETRFRAGESDADMRRRRAERILPNAPTPDSVAATVCFLASDEAAAITGQMFVVDAGVSIHRPIHAITMYEDL